MNHAGNEGPIELSTDPRDRMGVFKRIEDVPDRYSLANYGQQYEGQDTWAEHAPEVHGDSASTIRRTERAGLRWKEHMAERGRHHALATPDDVDAYIGGLLDTIKPRTVYQPYWVRLMGFYDWLMWHTNHPHVYNPVLMAAAEKPHAKHLWEFIMGDVRNE